MQAPNNYQQYPPQYPPQQYTPYPAQKKPGSAATVLAAIALVLAVVALILGIIAMVSGPSGNPNFRVENFTLEKGSYEYIYTDYYSGTGDVVTSDTSHPYIVVLKLNRISGGSYDDDPVSYMIVQVVDGEGSFYTYDSGTSGTFIKPSYDFEIVGFVKLEN